MTKIEYHKCDIVGCGQEADHVGKKVQTIFLTEQTEGRSVKPHLSTETLDLCAGCYGFRLRGNDIYGSGAQGHNRYWFKAEKNYEEDDPPGED